MANPIDLDGKLFIPADQMPLPEWGCVLSSGLEPTLTIKDDDLFLISNILGNVSACGGDGSLTSLGLFCRDTRFLSRLELQIEGRSPILLSSNAQKGFALSVLCSNPRIHDQPINPDNHQTDKTIIGQSGERLIPAETIGIQRDIALYGGLFEEITLTNYGPQAIQFELSLSFAADFIDLFEVRGFGRKKRGQLLRLVEPKSNRSEKPKSDETEEPISSYELPQTISEFTMAYMGLDGAMMESRIQFQYRLPDRLKGYTALWQINLESHESLQLGYRLQMLIDNKSASMVSSAMTLGQARESELLEEKEWKSSITQIRTDNKTFNQMIERAEQDIYLLRQSFGNGKILSAGLPWFSTLFGRDSIISASQTLILDPVIARETLIILAHYQGKVDNSWREEEPGKILHEIRFGEMARCHEIPHTPYYGTIDATPLWLMLYAEYYAWTDDRSTLNRLWDNALAAMDWIDRNCRKTGYLAYHHYSERGLQNQGWKDSGDCIIDRDGTLATGSITLSEVQGYVYAAKIRMSELARIKKRIDLADRWQDEAHELKARFNQDFWLTDLDYCALALDGNNKPVDSITSNPGHCLNLGIFTPEHAVSVAARLRSPDMFNGWGIHTLSNQSPAYNPMGYHLGSVWPHDNGLIALGLRSLGLVDQALELAQGIFDMTLRQPYQRPPELFCGYERLREREPVQYPVACSPQAWASGAIFQLLRMMINVVPDAPGNHLRIIDPALPDSIHRLSIKNLRVGSSLIDLDFIREVSSTETRSGATACRVAKKRGQLRVIIEA